MRNRYGFLTGIRAVKWGFVLLFLCLSAEGEEQTVVSASKEVVSEGMLPVPQYGGDWMQREYLTGDWGGLRQNVGDDGVLLRGHLYQVYQRILSGGREDHAGEYGLNLDLYAEFDLMRMGLIPGGVISLRTQSRTGKTVNEQSGLLLPVNTASLFPVTSPSDKEVPIALTELNYMQFLSEQFGILVGKITTMEGSNEFAGGEGVSQFMNLQMTTAGILAQFVPYSTLTLGGIWIPSENVLISSMLMNQKDASMSSGFSDIDEGTIWMSSVSYSYQAGNLPGGITAGAAYAFNSDFTEVGSIGTQKANDTWGVFSSLWQYIYLEEKAHAVDPTNGRQDLQGLGFFLTGGVGDKTVSLAPINIALGLSGLGTLPLRPNDQWGVGYFYNDVQDDVGEWNSEILPSFPDPIGGSAQGFEAYYNIALTGSMDFGMDFQWVDSATKAMDDAVILAGRLTVRF